MAKIHADAGGNILRFTQSDADELRFPTPPAGTTQTIEFDADANPTVVDALNGKVAGVRWQDHTVSGGKLKRKGVDVVLLADTDKKKDKDALPAILAKLTAGTKLSDAEQTMLLRHMLRKLGENV